MSETTMPRALIFGIKHHLIDLYQACSKYAPVAKMASPKGHRFYIGLYEGHLESS